MKWSVNQVAELHQMCIDGVSNADIAKHFDVPITEIHAKRSQLGITIPKIAALKSKFAATEIPKSDAAIQEMKTITLPRISDSFFTGLLELLLFHANCHVRFLQLKEPNGVDVWLDNGVIINVKTEIRNRLKLIKDVCDVLGE